MRFVFLFQNITKGIIMVKKLSLFFVLLIISVCVFADSNIEISNSKISIVFSETSGRHITAEKITDPVSGENFIRNTDRGCDLWIVNVKKAGDISGQAWSLCDKDAESFSYEKKQEKIIFKWKNVKKQDMVSGFDVTCSVKLKDENSYWDIEVSPNKEYGIFEVFFPQIDLDTKNGDELLWPAWCSGRIYTEFDDPKGFPITKPMAGDYSTELGYYTPFLTEICSLTKNGVSLYLSPEDKIGYIKSVNINLYQPNIVTYRHRVHPKNACKGNKGFKSPFSHNLAIVHGDWYNVAKKYREWGIKNNFGVFKLGKLENRRDLPDWYKLNNIWYRFDVSDDTFESLKDLVSKTGKGIVHVYGQTHYKFDTHYPNWLPLREKYFDYYKELQDMGLKIMPYTNGHLVDTALSHSYEKYGDALVNLDEYGKNRPENYAEIYGAKNVVACPDTAYQKVYLDEVSEMMRQMNYDVLYIDQLGMYSAFPCYNKEHSHAVGGGDYHTNDYKNLILNVKKSLKEIKGTTVPITTEGSGEGYYFDGWLRLSDTANELLPIPINMFIFGDYAVNFGTWNNRLEFETPDEISAINKTAMTLVKGHQLGWFIGSFWEGKKAPKFTAHLAKTAKARDSHVKYFSYGEMVRPVNIENNPKKNILYVIGWTEDRCKYYDFPLVKTCSLNLHGKTMICFTSVSDTPVKVDWSQKAKDLNLKDKSIYKIKQTYANDKKSDKDFPSLGEFGEVKSSFTIDPFDTVMFVAE